MRKIGRLVRERDIEVVHGHEWPPIVEAFFGARIPLEPPSSGQ